MFLNRAAHDLTSRGKSLNLIVLHLTSSILMLH